MCWNDGAPAKPVDRRVVGDPCGQAAPTVSAASMCMPELAGRVEQGWGRSLARSTVRGWHDR